MPRPTRILIALLAWAALLGPGPAGAFTAPEAKAPMTVTLVRGDAADCGADCPEWLALTGRILPGSQNLLAAALARLGRRRLPILLDSPGGETTVGLAMGRMIRAHRLDAAVAATVLTACEAADRACQARLRGGQHPGHIGPAPGAGVAACASACVFLLAGGVDRAVAPGAYVGVHQAMRVLTFHPVMNTFRILRRLVNGRAVEVSRTLVATRALPIRVVKESATQGMYSEFDRYLLAMGVDGSIMPLMRATPPTGIHWLTLPELASTRIANDTTEPGPFVARAVPPSAAPSSTMGLAAVTLADGHRWMGIVDWHIDRAAPGPALVGVVDVPERRLRGTLTIRRATEPGSVDGFTILADIATGAGAPAAADLHPPDLCDPTLCGHPAAVESDAGGRGRRFGVISAWGDSFLTQLQGRSWLKIDMTTEGGMRGAMDLSLFGGPHGVVGEWEHLCCGKVASDPGPTEPPPWPDAPAAPAPAMPPPAVVAPAAGSSDVPVAYVLQGPIRAPASTAGVATLNWTELPGVGRAEATASLLGTIEVKAAGLHLSLQAGPAPADRQGGVLLAISLVPDPARFGPATALSVPPIWGPDSHVAMLAVISNGRYGGGFDATLVVPSDIPPDAALTLELSDSRGRGLNLTIPVYGALARLLKAAQVPAG